MLSINQDSTNVSSSLATTDYNRSMPEVLPIFSYSMLNITYFRLGGSEYKSVSACSLCHTVHITNERYKIYIDRGYVIASSVVFNSYLLNGARYTRHSLF